MLDLFEEESYFEECEDDYVDVTALISSCKSAQRNEYAKSNLAVQEDLERSLELHSERVRDGLRRWKDVFGPLLPTATVEKLMSMDLEVLDDHQNASDLDRFVQMQKIQRRS